MGDAFARFKRMQGFNVLYPMGFDAFGLPAENAAIKNKTHPKEYTENAISGIKKNQKALGLSYDWSRELATCYPEYYKWNQWVFLKMLKKGLAYKKEAPVNWCPKCETVLANEQVKNGLCWRCESGVVGKKIEQWFLKITKYADKLLENIDKLEWPEKIKSMQKNWIGKSHGVDIYFKMDGTDERLPTFTTRCDTVFSVTFLAVAPEHPMVKELVAGTGREKDALEFVEQMKRESMIDRMNEEKEKEGIFTGKYAINPVNGERVPIYIANFAVMYGSGIVMCDAHDKRDFRFARKYGIPLTFVISKDGSPIDPEDFDDAFTDDGILFGSGKFNGMKNMEALPKMADWLEKKGYGKKVVNYKLKDWGISRQRYWGTPIPIVYCDKCGMVPVPEKQLPVILPLDVKFTGHGNPLAKLDKFVKVKCPKCGGPGRRETDTMDTFVDSSWYFLRYCSPKSKQMFDTKAIDYWMPVDQYIGGAEHAVMHLLYARFFTMVLKDLGLLGFEEPFTRLFNQGIVYKDGHKMSKSFGNVVTQEEISKKYGIDTARLFLLFVASPDSQLEWSDEGVIGSYKFLYRIRKIISDHFEKKDSGRKAKPRTGNLETKDKQMTAKLHSTIKKVTENMNHLGFNKAIGSMMGFTNSLVKYAEDPHGKVFNESVESLLAMLSPFSPHTCEELWETIDKNANGKDFISLAKWPITNEKLIDPKLELMEQLVEQTSDDIREIIKLVGKKPKEIFIYVSPLWKYEVHATILKSTGKSGKENIIKEIMKNSAARKEGKLAVRFGERLAKETNRLGSILNQKDELLALNEASSDLEKEFSCKVLVLKAEEKRNERSLKAEPGKPGIEII